MLGKLCHSRSKCCWWWFCTSFRHQWHRKPALACSCLAMTSMAGHGRQTTTCLSSLPNNSKATVGIMHVGRVGVAGAFHVRSSAPLSGRHKKCHLGISTFLLHFGAVSRSPQRRQERKLKLTNSVGTLTDMDRRAQTCFFNFFQLALSRGRISSTSAFLTEKSASDFEMLSAAEARVMQKCASPPETTLPAAAAACHARPGARPQRSLGTGWRQPALSAPGQMMARLVDWRLMANPEATKPSSTDDRLT